MLFRVPLVLLALVLGIYSAFSFQHKCSLGVKWFENNTIWFLPLAYGVACLVPRRRWVAVALLVVTFVIVNYCFAPAYRSVIHPNGER